MNLILCFSKKNLFAFSIHSHTSTSLGWRFFHGLKRSSQVLELKEIVLNVLNTFTAEIDLWSRSRRVSKVGKFAYNRLNSQWKSQADDLPPPRRNYRDYKLEMEVKK